MSKEREEDGPAVFTGFCGDCKALFTREWKTNPGPFISSKKKKRGVGGWGGGEIINKL